MSVLLYQTKKGRHYMIYRIAAVLAFLGIQLSTICMEDSSAKQASASFAEFDRKAQESDNASSRKTHC